MKSLFKVLGGLVALLVITVVLITVFIDPNDYKPEIEAQAKQSLNRQLVIEGDLSWGFYPTLGISTGKVKILNPKGFNRDNLIAVNSVSVGINLLPLLTGNVELGKLALDGFKLNVITNHNGASNIDGIGQAESAQSNTEQTNEPASSNPIASLSLAGLVISDAQIEMQDLVNKTSSTIKLTELSLGEFTLGAPADLKIMVSLASDGINGDLVLDSQVTVSEDLNNVSLGELTVNSTLTGASLPNGDLTLALSSRIDIAMQPVRIAIDELALNANDIQLTGNVNIALGSKTKVRYELNGNVWNLDQFIPKDTAQAPASEQPEVEPDLSFLNGLDVDGKLLIAGIKVNGLTLGKTLVRTIVQDGVAKLAPLSAQLYQGSIEVNAQVLDGNGQNSYAFDKQIKGVSIQPLLQDLADTELLAGTTNLSFKGAGRGLTVSKIKQKLAGAGSFEILDGALYGINIPQKIRSAKASLSGNTVADGDQQKKTDFTALTGTFSMDNGIVNNNALNMSAPFLRVEGKGLANIIASTLDYKLKTTLVGTSKGQGGSSSDDLTGLAIPLKIEGSFTDPKFSLDTSGALKAKLDQEKDKAKSKLKDKLKDKLGDLFK